MWHKFISWDYFVDSFQLYGGIFLVRSWKCQKSFIMDTAHVSIFIMVTSSNGNIFRVTGPLCGEFTGHQWIPRTKASDAELWCFLWSAPWINGSVNNREAGNLRRHRAHYDVIVMGDWPTPWYLRCWTELIRSRHAKGFNSYRCWILYCSIQSADDEIMIN